jgi:hypothetical protein
MTTKTTLRTLAALGAVSASALAVPAVASAHPFVYPSTAKVAVTPATTPASFTDQQRYVTGNHGFTYLLRETNGRGPGTPSVIAWNRSEGRSGDAIVTSPAAQTGAQAHATCDVASLDSTAVIRSWQADPFYAYVPFQTGAAGLEDDPSKWLPVVKSATGVDLTQVADTDAARKAACESTAVGGTYSPADTTQSTTATFNSGLITETRAPFITQVATLRDQLAAAQAAKAAADQAAAAGKARADAAEAKVAQTPAAPKPLAATLTKKAFTPAELAATGIPVAVTGPAGQVVRVRATVSAAQARRHGLPSTVLGSKAGVVSTVGTVAITVRPSASQGRKLRAAKGAVPVTLELVVATTKATVGR